MRALGAGAEPGVITNVAALPAGTYVVSYWAMTDAGGRAEMHMSLGGDEAKSAAVGEEWTAVTGTVTVKKDRKGAALRIWTTTGNMQVWVDDVEVKRSR
ncbi:MAG: hypothetical protein ACYS9X_15680 [Planctomycetota bacterium]